MFHPTSNRLSRFFELSALFIQQAQSGGYQSKAGLLSIEGASKTKGAFGRKGLNWFEKKQTRWCAVRESYLVVSTDPGEAREQTIGRYVTSIDLHAFRLKYLRFFFLTQTSRLNVLFVYIARASTSYKVATLLKPLTWKSLQTTTNRQMGEPRQAHSANGLFLAYLLIKNQIPLIQRVVVGFLFSPTVVLAIRTMTSLFESVLLWLIHQLTRIRFESH